MQKGPSVTSYTKAINQITGNLPLYRPNKKGDMLLRVLPMFSEGQEEVWVDFSIGSDDENAGLGNQHYSVSAISVFRDRAMSWLSAVSKDNADDADDTAVKSPATLAAERMRTMTKKADAMLKAGHQNIRDEFIPNSFGGSWIGVQQLNLVQALVARVGGQPLKDREGNPFRYGIVDLTTSAFQDLASKLFTPRIADASGTVKATSSDDSSLGDYVSCDGGNWLIIRYDAQTKPAKYKVVLSAPPPGFSDGRISAEYCAAVVKPWYGVDGALYKIPTHQQVFEAMQDIIPFDILGFCLIDTMFETLLTPAMVEAGRQVQLTVAEDRVVEAATLSGTQETSAYPAAPARPAVRPSPPPAPAAARSGAAVTRAPAPPAPARGPTPPAPPAPRPPAAAGMRPAFPKPVRQPLNKTLEEMGPLPHMGDETQDFADPADAAPAVDLG
jgi:hypothetical protein